MITALGSPEEAVEAVHGYGGKSFTRMSTAVEFRPPRRGHWRVDGLALICAGAGGHTGQLSPFAFVDEVRQFFDGEIILSGAVGNGRAISAPRKCLGPTMCIWAPDLFPAMNAWPLMPISRWWWMRPLGILSPRTR